jgi:AcrR family transcriptional regulator
MNTAEARAQRAAALPPDQRRAAIAEATLALLSERGAAVTTRQIAEAAGVAEGTIFRVFEHKDAVLRAALELAFDPAPTERKLATIDRDQPFEGQLAAAVEILQAQVQHLWRLVSAVADTDALRGRKAEPPRDLAALTELFEPHARRLRHPPAVAARELRALTLAVSHPALYADQPPTPPEIVSLLLHGITKSSGKGPAC